MKEYSYLGIEITSDRRSCTEIISEFTETFNKKKHLFTLKDISLFEECYTARERIVDIRRRSEEKTPDI